MKYLNLLCNTLELHCLFPDAKILEINKIDSNLNVLKIESNGEQINIHHYTDTNLFLKIQNSKNVIEMDSYYTNPIQDLTIVCDRKLWYELYFPLLKHNPKLFAILEQRYVEKNVTVFFNFAILEAVNYEDEEEYFSYDFKFNNIKITDYELFKDKKNFYYNPFYNLYHLLAEGQMISYLYPNMLNTWDEYHLDFNKIFENFNINNKIYRPYIYTHTCLKPRYHRIKFLLEADKNGILGFGKNNVNEKFIDEYQQTTNNGFIFTDNTTKHTKNHKNNFNKELFDKFMLINHKINITKDEPDFLYDHLKNYFVYKEYNDAYIDVVGETHCIFDLKYGFFTEKSLKPILSENFCMIYGSNSAYKEFKNIGIDLFLNEFGLDGIEDKNELEQIDMIISSLKNMDIHSVKELYIKNYKTIKKNKKLLFNHYCNIMNNINVLLLKNK